METADFAADTHICRRERGRDGGKEESCARPEILVKESAIKIFSADSGTSSAYMSIIDSEYRSPIHSGSIRPSH